MLQLLFNEFSYKAKKKIKIQKSEHKCSFKNKAKRYGVILYICVSLKTSLNAIAVFNSSQ